MIHDGIDVGLALAETPSALRLIEADGTRVHLYDSL